jgi:hypothetical protein
MTASKSWSMPAARVWKLGRSSFRTAPDGVEKVRQPFALALGEHDRDGTDMPDEGVEFRTVGADGLELELFGLGEGFWELRIHPATVCGEGGRVECDRVRKAAAALS